MNPLSPAALLSARIDRLPPSRPLWGLVARISFGAFFEIYETALTSLIAPALVAAGIFHAGKGGLFGLPDLATFAFATFAGLFLGALVFSAVADRYGRRPIFTWSLLWYALATLVMSGLHSAAGICLWRLIASIGVGAEVVAIDSYLSEMVPKAMRGRGFAISKALQYTAVPIAGLLAVLLSKRVLFGIDGWRFLLIVPVLGALLIWQVRRGLPESPRWLAEHGQFDEGLLIVEHLEAKVERVTGHKLPPFPVPPDVSRGFEPALVPGSYASLFRGALLSRTMMLIVASCAGAAAYYGFGNWLPTLLEARGVTITKSLLYSTLIALSYPLAPLLFSYIADRSERKWQMVTGAGIVAIAGLLFARQTTAAGWLTFGLLLTIGNNLTSYSTHTYRSELFPTALRARGIGLVYSIERLVTAFNGYIVGFLLLRGGVRGVFVFLVAASILNMLTISIFGPRTANASLHEIGLSAALPMPAQEA